MSDGKCILNCSGSRLRRTQENTQRQTIFFSFQSLASGWGGQYSFRCQPVDYSRSPTAMRMARGCWWYYFSKFTEFADTIFFVLRKKNEHISTLHVIHHGIMPMSVWFGVKFTPGTLIFLFWIPCFSSGVSTPCIIFSLITCFSNIIIRWQPSAKFFFIKTVF